MKNIQECLGEVRSISDYINTTHSAPVNEGLKEKFDYVYDRSDRRMQRPKNEIGLSAVRGGTIVGEHEVIFAGTDEVIELKHTAYSKSVFAHPIEIFLVILMAGNIGGVVGMIIAIPSYTLIRIIAKQLLSEFKFIELLTKKLEVKEKENK